MRRTGFDETRDHQIAAETMADRALMCGADNCPRRWSVSVGGSRGLCSAHAWVEPHLWPRVTQQILDDDLDRARGLHRAPEPKRVDRATAMQRLREFRFGAAPAKQWAEELERREREGARLTPFQREAWREAIGEAE